MMTIDAPFTGWGCCFDTVTTGGNWTPEEAAHDINYLEMLATISGKQPRPQDCLSSISNLR